MTLSAEEQYLLELINRARLDPEAEAARYGIDLNAGLTAGTLAGGSRQVLAPNALLEQAATDHSLWMLATDTFSHTGAGGSSPGDRAQDAGYTWMTYGENIAWWGTSASSFNITSVIESHHSGLFLSAGHRLNILNDSFREVGLGRESGAFTTTSGTWNASMLTELFGANSTRNFLTGVAYDDRNGDRFYSVGEGQAGTSFSVLGNSVATASAGGYGIAADRAVQTMVTGTTGAGTAFALYVDMSQGNVKLDILGGSEFLTSGSISLIRGITDATLLGLDNLSLTGSAQGNNLTGNVGNNQIKGLGGHDVLRGLDGNDRLFGNGGNDSLSGGAGIDFLRGDAGDDLLTGGAGADRFIFLNFAGADLVSGFSMAEGDRLRIDDAIWGGTALSDADLIARYVSVTADGVVFDFENGLSFTLDGLNSTAGLDRFIDVF